MSSDSPKSPDDYVPDHRLTEAYEEADRLDHSVYEALCPSYLELSHADDRYEDEKLLGQGALKDVYRAYDNCTRRWVAMARLRKEHRLQYYDHFVREAWLIASLSHPNIIKVHDAGIDGEGRPFFTMDLKGNTSLTDLIRKEGPRTLPELLEIFKKVCDAVAYAHSHGVIHLDLKPDNIQCDRFGEVLVCDWGLGQKLGEDPIDLMSAAARPLPRPVDAVTQTEEIQGTLGFMAPEQVIADTEKDHRTDVYALGCILYTILCGEPPFVGSKVEVLEDTKQSRIISPRSRFPERSIPESLEAVAMKATAKDPDDRYASVLLLRQEIQNYLNGYATVAEEPGFIREARLFLRRNRLPVGIAAAALVVLGIFVVLFVQYLDEEQLATEEERQRANRLLLEVDDLSFEYDLLFEESIMSKKELAVMLADSANDIKNTGFFLRPIGSLDQSERLVNMALEIDPECLEAKWQRIRINCVKLNYVGALEDASNKRFQSSNLRKYAKAFPQYNFSREARPSVEQMNDFYKKAKEISPRLESYLERVFVYNHEAIKNRNRQYQVLNVFLESIHGGPGAFKLDYNFKKMSASVWTRGNSILRFNKGGASRQCFLRFLKLKSLKVSTAGSFNLADLNRLLIETLDIRDCHQIKLEKSVALSRLQTLHIRRGQILPEELRHNIRTFESLEIIEDDSESLSVGI